MISDMNKTRYTHRDYESLKADLINAIPSLTQEWTSREDSDPGIVLIKLMSMFGDNLSYNIDKMALEVYLDTVTQRKNCAKILQLLGYKMHWYRSAQVLVHCRLLEDKDSSGSPRVCVLHPFKTKFKAGDIYYTVVDQGYGTGDIDIVSSDKTKAVRLVEGTVREVSFNSSDLINNRYYFAEKNIDEKHLWMTYGVRHTCVLVDNLYSETSSTNVTYEFNVDEYDNPYIELINYWQDIVGANTNTRSSNDFSLRYIISHGSEGNVTNDAFTNVIGSSDNSNLRFTNLTNDSVDILDESNYNTRGYNPQEVSEAKADAKKYVFTHNTLVSTSDFEKAAVRVDNVTASKIVDRTVIENEALDEASIVNRARDTFGNNTEKITYNVRNRNLIPFPYADNFSKEINGITFTVEEDGRISATGTATDTASFTLYSNTVNPVITLERGTTYVISGINLGELHYTDNQNVIDIVVNNMEEFDTENKETLFMVQSISINIPKGSTVTSLLFEPQLEKALKATNYEPVKVTRTSIISNELLPYVGILYIGYQDFNLETNSYKDGTDSYVVSNYDTPTKANLGYYPYKPSSYVQLAINDKIKSAEIMNTSVEFGTVKLYPFKVAGTVYLIEPMSPIDCLAIIEDIDSNLKSHFYPTNHDFGDRPSFVDVAEVIQSSSTKIKYFDAIDMIIKYSNGCDLTKFDTTSFVVYNGLSSEFNLADSFLKYKLRSLSTSDNVELSTLGALRGSTIQIAPQQTLSITLKNIEELRALCQDIQSSPYLISII